MDPVDDVRARLRERRTLLLTGPLDASTLEQAIAELLLLDAAADDPVDLRIMGRDADLDSALALADAIDLVAIEVRAHATGTLGGAALAPFAAAGRRLAAPNAMFILSDPPAGPGAAGRDLPQQAEQFERQRTTLHHRLAAACGTDLDQIAADMRQGLVLDAAAAEAYGLVESVVRSRP